jgi:hypothetical protein
MKAELFSHPQKITNDSADMHGKSDLSIIISPILILTSILVQPADYSFERTFIIALCKDKSVNIFYLLKSLVKKKLNIRVV